MHNFFTDGEETSDNTDVVLQEEAENTIYGWCKQQVSFQENDKKMTFVFKKTAEISCKYHEKKVRRI